MPKSDDQPKGVKIRIAPDIAEAFKARGDDWEAQIDAALRAHLGQPRPERGAKMKAFFADLAGPAMPQLEQVARDVASKVAKDVASAAAAAALAAWASSKEKPAPATPKAAAAPKAAAKPVKPAPRRAARPAPKAPPKKPPTK